VSFPERCDQRLRGSSLTQESRDFRRVLGILSNADSPTNRVVFVQYSGVYTCNNQRTRGYVRHYRVPRVRSVRSKTRKRTRKVCLPDSSISGLEREISFPWVFLSFSGGEYRDPT